MHHDGEVDVRGTYTVIAIASLLNMLTPQLTEGVVDWLLTCVRERLCACLAVILFTSCVVPAHAAAKPMKEGLVANQAPRLTVATLSALLPLYQC
jgi:hypothetical protein